MRALAKLARIGLSMDDGLPAKITITIAHKTPFEAISIVARRSELLFSYDEKSNTYYLRPVKSTASVVPPERGEGRGVAGKLSVLSGTRIGRLRDGFSIVVERESPMEVLTALASRMGFNLLLTSNARESLQGVSYASFNISGARNLRELFDRILFRYSTSASLSRGPGAAMLEFDEMEEGSAPKRERRCIIVTTVSEKLKKPGSR